MIYGAYGYTGRLVAEQAVAEGDAPLLAGRRAEPLRRLADEFGLPWRVASLEDSAGLRSALEEVEAVIHCAGPFSRTSRPMLDACLATGRHYLDITGEVDVFEAVRARDAEARAAGVVLLPGAGFDVVPSDCLAAALAERLPGADALELAFATEGGGLSPGTTKTALEGLPRGGLVRRNGRLEHRPPAHRTRLVPFSDRPRRCAAIPWGDVSTAYQSTEIPNITVYTALPGPALALVRLAHLARGLLARPSAQALGRRAVEALVRGPGPEARRRARTHLWGRVSVSDGASLEGTLDVPEGYSFTARAALACAERILAGEVPPGATTPSLAFGADFVLALPDVTRRIPR